MYGNKWKTRSVNVVEFSTIALELFHKRSYDFIDISENAEKKFLIRKNKISARDSLFRIDVGCTICRYVGSEFHKCRYLLVNRRFQEYII